MANISTTTTTMVPSTQLALSQTNDKNNPRSNDSAKKKRNVNILKVVLMLVCRSPAKSNATNVAPKGMWKRLIDSMRPLHLQSNQSPEQTLSLPSTAPKSPLHNSPSVENFEDVLSPSFSPNIVELSPSSIDNMSRYASAVNLQELDEDNNNGKANVNDGDEMIDAKAEVFIAQFYEQMRLQRSNSVLQYDQMIERSIG
ncbi:uncharacterized protein LOC111022447 [Momordica charantia]|uniref:Uncharacterized protein LOC111022447 n=1 Tax=Momordica charantia TaxID=3673 RepID=A0A6J1DM47_MOMCH|nr:uncharacterized protein LOC111022447 [Momordica charantia]